MMMCGDSTCFDLITFRRLTDDVCDSWNVCGEGWGILSDVFGDKYSSFSVL